MTKTEQLQAIKEFINKHGKLITINNGNKLRADRIVTSDMWVSSTIDVVVSGHRGWGIAYFHKKRKIWYFSGLAPFDVDFIAAKGHLNSPKFVSAALFHKFRKTL